MPMSKTVCFLCESILNFVQKEATDPKIDASIQAAMKKSCKVFPSSVLDLCIQFVNQYNEAFIALVAQNIDPSIVGVLKIIIFLLKFV